MNKKDEKGKDILSINYLKLNIDLLMKIIESRQKISIQRLEFDNDFKETFVIDDDDGDDNDNECDKNDENNDGHNNNNNNNNNKDGDKHQKQKK